MHGHASRYSGLCGQVANRVLATAMDAQGVDSASEQAQLDRA